MYKHVDILNKHGYPAFALHRQKGFRLIWFDNETNVIYFDEFKRLYHPDRDFLVLPEDLGSKILSFPGQKVIFNQNCYY
ncbi:MAG: glycosyltransferase family 1 protein, partial [candidate division KSB1 bacterium]|nr:glycosyltransferase family 1 protein [candidate division KSB1 bacterium]